MKKFAPFIFGILIFIGIFGFKKHERNTNFITKNLSEIIKDNGIEKFEIQEINLPLNYTIFNQKVISNFFILINKKIKVIEYTVVPKGGYPILSIFKSFPSYIRIDSFGMLELMG
tara:strand:- start:52 stop:396 length:345 start_codon:yes stop_codon:yes gene_type:complete